MAPPIIDLTGKRFGRLVVTRASTERAANGGMRWVARCECGSEKRYDGRNLKRMQSCGCATRLKSRETLVARLLEKSIPEPNSGCWLWLGGLTKYETNGYGAYGTFSLDGKGVKAHRASFEAFCREVPEGMEVCHHCDNPICINPDHLFLGTHLANMADRDLKRRRCAPKGTDNGFAKLTNETVTEIRNALGTQTEIAERFGTHQTNVSLIRQGKRWGHIA